MAWLNLVFNLIFIALVDINDLDSKSPWLIYKGIEDGANRYNLPMHLQHLGRILFYKIYLQKVI